MTEGDEVGILCEVKRGPFSGERLISFESIDGPVTGFVREADLKERKGQWLVRAIVLKVEKDVVSVRVRGSFFTTNGLATVPKDMALAA